MAGVARPLPGPPAGRGSRGGAPCALFHLHLKLEGTGLARLLVFFVVPSSLPLAVSEVRISPGFRVMVPAVGCCWLEVCSDASGPQRHVHARMSCMCWVMLSGCWLSVGRNAAASRARRGELSSPVLSWRVMAVPTAVPTTAAPTRCHRRPLRSRRQSQHRRGPQRAIVPVDRLNQRPQETTPSRSLARC